MSAELKSKRHEVIKSLDKDEGYGVHVAHRFWYYHVLESEISDLFQSFLSDVYPRVESEAGKKKKLPSFLSKVKQVIRGKTKAVEDRHLHSARVFYESVVEARRWYIEVLRSQEEISGEVGKWPAYAIKDFQKIIENVQDLENAGDNKSQILYYIMEIETLLGRAEEKARVTNRKYEARLAASLRDICRVHEPSEISEEQIKCFKGCVTALIEGWGKLNREKVSWIRGRLLEAGLTWLPITNKAAKDISKAQSMTE